MGRDMPSSEVAAVILNYNSAELTVQLCEELLGFELRPCVLVVDNCSEKPDFEVLRRYGDSRPEIELIRAEENSGYSAGNNLGISRALEEGYDYVLVVNPDASISEQSLGNMLKRMSHEPDVLFCGPRILDANGEMDRYAQRFQPHDLKALYFTKYPIARFKWNSCTRRYFGLDSDRSRDSYCATVSGCCVLFDRKYFEIFGLFDEDFFLYSEEVVWGHNVATAGFRCLYVADATATHDHPLVQRQTSFTTFSNRLRSDLVYCRKYLGVSRMRILPLLAYYYAAFLFLKLTSRGSLGGDLSEVNSMVRSQLARFEGSES